MKEYLLDNKRYMMGELCMDSARKLRALESASSSMILEAALVAVVVKTPEAKVSFFFFFFFLFFFFFFSHFSAFLRWER